MNPNERAEVSPFRFSLAGWWLVGCAWLNVAGWVLSALGELNAGGYAVAIGCGLASTLVFRQRSSRALRKPMRLSKIAWRFKHLLPLLFIIYAVLAFVGGVLYAPANYDGLTYRLPRLLHWLAEHRWHWITTVNWRMNISATGFEWLMAPLVALTRSDRSLFLLNALAYLLMPGLTYGAFTRVGVRRRAAWYWMWLLPTGYCYITQAGSIGNDLLAAVYLLAAIHFTLRARESKSIADLALGAIAAAMLTAAKASNLPLLLPWVVAALASLRLAVTRPAACSAIALLCAVISFLPIALANIHYSGDWAGDPGNKGNVKIQDPVYGVLGNGLLFLAANSAPPLLPVASALNEKLRIEMQSPFFQNLLRHYPRFKFSWPEIAQEEGAGIGLGLSALLIITSIGALACQRLRRPTEDWSTSGALHLASNRDVIGPLGSRKIGIAVCLGAWVALLAYMAKMGSEAAARLVSPYYPLLFASVLLLPGNVILVRQRWWKGLALVAALSALPAIILSATRPLWPAETVCGILKQNMPGNRLVDRATAVYTVYGSRADVLGPLRKYLPANANAIGFLGTEDEPETSLWRPFGSRRVVDVTREKERRLANEGISILVVSADAVQEAYQCSLDEWVQQRRVRILGREKLVVKVARGPEDWAVLELNAGAEK